jgi:hypothetical protein
MSKKNSKKALQKKKDREKMVRKKVIETRMEIRKERKMEKLREDAYEREFKNKEKTGMSLEEVKKTIEHNMKVLAELTVNSEADQYMKNAAIQEAQEQMKMICKIEAEQKAALENTKSSDSFVE